MRRTEPLRLRHCVYYCEHWSARYWGQDGIGCFFRLVPTANFGLVTLGWSGPVAVGPIGTVVVADLPARSRTVHNLLLGQAI